MDRDKAREYVTHRLNGELDAEAARELDAYLAERPEFAEEAKRMELVWSKLDLLQDSSLPAPAMGAKLRETLAAPEKTKRNRLPFFAAWMAAAAAVILVVSQMLPPTVNQPPAPSPGKIPAVPAHVDEPSSVSAADTARTTAEPRRKRRNVFAAIKFPAVEAKSGDSALAIEVPRKTGNARLLRARGLVIMKGPEDTRWRLLRRGAEIPKGYRVRVPGNPAFGAILLGPDGSTVTMKAGAEIAYLQSRQWRLKRGAAYFAVAKLKQTEPAPSFTVRTPSGNVTARDTEFALYVTPRDKKQGAATLCEVAAGSVQIGPPPSPPGFKTQPLSSAIIAAGKIGLIDAKGARLVDTTPGSRDWLAAIQARSATDESMAQLVVKAGEQGKRLPLEIHKYEVDVTVVDGVARTFLDMTFFNHTDRRLEGTFFYSLPADATVSQFQMYVGEKLIVGEVLEQQRARQIFEYIRREQRDPALLEWAGGNLFKMRVYPIEPKSEKRIQLGYTQILPRREGRVSYTFPLVSEMLTKNPLRRLAIHFKVLSSPGLFDLQCPTHQTGMGISRDRTRAALAFRARNYTPRRDFRVTWSVPDSAEFLVLSNRRDDEDEGYFLAWIDPKIQAASREPPQRLLILLDGSASVKAQSFSVAREFAGAAAEMTGEGWDFNLALTGAKVKFWEPEFQPAEAVDFYGVKEFLDQRRPLGGTDLLRTFRSIAASLPTDRPVRIIYVGDGVDTLGELEGAALVAAIADLFKGHQVELSCVAIGSSYDKPFLAALATRMGGTFRAVEGVSDVFAAADSILDDFYRPVLRDVKLSFEGVEVAGLYPPELDTLAVGDTGLVLGRIIKGGEGKVVVTGFADGQEFRREYEVSLREPTERNRFLPRLWAKAHMDALRARMGLGARQDAYLRGQVIATSIRYQIMSPYTAFLVLESEEDYKRFGIVRRLRMLDWRGEIDGAHERAISRAQPKTRLKPAELRRMFLPEPGLSLNANAARPNLLPAARPELMKALRRISSKSGQVIYDLEELPTGRLTLGAGLSSPFSSEGNLLRAELADLKAKVAAMESMEMIPAANGNTEILTALRKKGAISIGGSIQMEIARYSRFDEGDEYDHVNATVFEDRKNRNFLGENAQMWHALTSISGVEPGDEATFKFASPVIANEKAWITHEFGIEDAARGAPDNISLFDSETSNGRALYDAGISWTLDVDRSAIPLSDVLVYPENWEDIKARVIRGRIKDSFDLLGGKGAFGRRFGGGRRRSSRENLPLLANLRAGAARQWRGGGAHNGYLDRWNIRELDAGDGQKLTVKRVPLAEIYLRRAALVKPDDPQIRLDLVLALRRQGKNRAALRELDVLLKSVPANSHLWLERAWLLHRTGAKEEAHKSVRTALALADKNRRETLRQRCGYELATLGLNREAAELFEKLAQESKDESRAVQFYGSAYGYAQSAKLKDAEKILDRALLRFPQNAQLHASAASYLQSANPVRALTLAEKAAALGADTFNQRVTILFIMKRRDEAWKLLEERFLKAKDAAQVNQALYQCRNRDQARASRWARQALEQETGPRLLGAIQFARSYGRTLGQATRKRLLDLAMKGEIPDSSRLSLFYLLNNRGRNKKWAGVLLPLLKNIEAKEKRALAFSALQSLGSHGYYKVAAPRLEAFLKLKDLNDSEKYQLAQARYQIESNSGDLKAAREHLEAAFHASKNAGYAYSHANTLLWAFLNQKEAKRAVEIVADMFARFPRHPNNRYLYRSLYQQLAQRGELAALKKLPQLVRQKRGQDKNKPAAVNPLLKQYAGILKTLREKKYAEGDGKLRAATAMLEAKQRELKRQLTALARKIDGVVAEIRKLVAAAAVKAQEKTKKSEAEEDPARKSRPESKVQSPESTLDLRKQQEEYLKLRREWAKLYREHYLATVILRRVRTLRPRVAAMDEAVRRAFLAECRERAMGEDPVAREWTNAALACLRFLADKQAYRKTLERLRQAEPRDPVWSRLLVNAYLLAGEIEKGRALLEALLQEDAEDIALAFSLYSLIEATGKADEVAAARDRFLGTLKQDANLLQQCASFWQRRKRTELAVRAYLALQDTDSHRKNGWPLYQAASIRENAGDKAGAADLYLRFFEQPEWAGSHAQNASQRLASMIADEAVLKQVEKKLSALLASDDAVRRAYGRLLAYRAAKTRNRAGEAKGHLEALLQEAFAARANVAYNLGRQVLAILQGEKMYARLAEYARTGFGEMTKQERIYLLQNAASQLHNQKESRGLARALYRELIEKNPGSANNYRRQIVNGLVQDGKLGDAVVVLKQVSVETNDWQAYNAHERVIRAYRDAKNYARAARMAYALWRKFDGEMQSYGSSAYYLFTEMCWRALENQALPDDIKDAVIAEIVENARQCFTGDPHRNWNSGYNWQITQKLELAGKLRALADAAAKSQDPQRLYNAAQFYQQTAGSNSFKNHYDRAIEMYRALLALPAVPKNLRQGALGQLYSIHANYKWKDWGAALETLEEWKQAGGLDKHSYLLNRTQCLYKLNRQKDARKAARKLLRSGRYRRYYWQAESVAQWCREAKDYAMEIECWEHSLRWMRRTRQVRPHYVARFYTALGRAYRNLGEKQKALDALLRGLSLLDRNNQSSYHRRLRRDLMQMMKTNTRGGLDKLVAYYEKNMRAGGEMPQLRITFALAYREAGKEEKALQQFALAADLLPQDTKLRQEVIAGYKRLKQNDEAEKAYLAWAKLDPQNLEVFRGLGQFYESLGRPEEAMQAYAAMPEARPREAAGHRAFAQVLLAKGKRDQARVAFRKAVKYRPTEFALAAELVGVYRSLHRLAEVEQLWRDGEAACQRAIKNLPDDPLSWLNLARFLKAQGRPAEARQLCREILARNWPRFANVTRREARNIMASL